MSNYNNGRRIEYEVRDHLRDNGYLVIRSAGSKSKVDLIAIKQGQMLLVQCKRTTGAIPPQDRLDLRHIARLANGLPIVAIRAPRQPIQYRELIGQAADQWRPWSPDELA